MPKTGLSSEEWRKRLREYARGNFSFGRGQKPSRSSVWAKVVCSIESCPLHRNLGLGGKDPFGRELHCTCGYHQSERVCQIMSTSFMLSTNYPSMTTFIISTIIINFIHEHNY